MKAFCITLEGHPYSEAKSARCIETARDIGGIEVTRFRAIPRDEAERVMNAYGLRWTWANGNTSNAACPKTGLKQHPYGALLPKMGCAMSHFLLWRKCVEIDEPLLILEHDAVFLRRLPVFETRGICQINDPERATPRGRYWSEFMQTRGTAGVHPKTKMFTDDIPDGLAGNSAYVVKPHAAQDLISAYREIGVWPNDATMCRQLFPYLDELYPFVTRVQQELSTSSI